VPGRARDPGRDGDPRGATRAHADHGRLHRRPQLLGDESGRLEVGIAGQDHELLPAIAGQHVRFAERRLGGTGEAFERLVAGWMAMCVVELLEMVEVEHDQADVPTVALCQSKFALEQWVEEAPLNSPVRLSVIASPSIVLISRAFESARADCSATREMTSRSLSLNASG